MNRPLAVTHAVLASAIAVFACQKKVDDAEAEGARVEAGARASALAPQAEDMESFEATAGPPVDVSAEKLERYLGYLRAVLDAESKGAQDGGHLALLEHVAVAEERARAKFGLDEREIDLLDEMVSDVLDERTYSQAAGLDKLIEQGEEMNRKLPAEQRADFEVELEEIRKQRDDAKNLPAERERYGSANVDVLLTREAELTKLWNERVRGSGGRAGQ